MGMEVYNSTIIDTVVARKLPPQPEPEAYKAAELEAPKPPTDIDERKTPTGGEISTYQLGDASVASDVWQKLDRALHGEMDFSSVGNKPVDKKQDAIAKLKQAGIDPTDHHVDTFIKSVDAGQNVDQALNSVRHDPLIFDLNGDGKTDATSNQHGVNVDGSTDTKWAAKGDGVLSMGDKPLGTVDSQGVTHKDAYETLKAEAQYAGVDTSKGYLDQADIAKLEAKGLTMMVSNGDGTNTPMKPSELGITQMSLGGKAVDKTDSAGNKVTSEGSFVQNGASHLVSDAWLNEIPPPKVPDMH